NVPIAGACGIDFDAVSQTRVLHSAKEYAVGCGRAADIAQTHHQYPYLPLFGTHQCDSLFWLLPSAPAKSALAKNARTAFRSASVSTPPGILFCAASIWMRIP